MSGDKPGMGSVATIYMLLNCNAQYSSTLATLAGADGGCNLTTSGGQHFARLVSSNFHVFHQEKKSCKQAPPALLVSHCLIISSPLHIAGAPDGTGGASPLNQNTTTTTLVMSHPHSTEDPSQVSIKSPGIGL